jgi:hypothetical protein
VDQRQLGVGADHRLRARRAQVDDAQTPVGEPGGLRAIHPHAVAVGTAVAQDLAHDAEPPAQVGQRRSVEADDARNPAHRVARPCTTC